MLILQGMKDLVGTAWMMFERRLWEVIVNRDVVSGFGGYVEQLGREVSVWSRLVCGKLIFELHVTDIFNAMMLQKIGSITQCAGFLHLCPLAHFANLSFRHPLSHVPVLLTPLIFHS